MTPFTRIEGRVAPIDRANIDTDAIIPKQFMKSITRTGLGPHLFDEWRYEDHGELGQDCSIRPKKVDFVLNKQQYAEATVLLGRANFGCGSSREHAPWALTDYGFRVLIAPSFADIFAVNCVKNGLLTVVLPEADIDELFAASLSTKGLRVSVDLGSQTVQTASDSYQFDIDPFVRQCLLDGADEVALTLRHRNEIAAYEDARRESEPWLFN